MRIVGDEDGVGLYFQGEVEYSLLVSLLTHHINLCIKDSMLNKSLFIEE